MFDKSIKRVIFCDFDGVLTNFNDTPGSYVTHSGKDYGVSKTNLDRLLKLAKETSSKIIMTTNWRRFSEDPASPFFSWHHPRFGIINNPLPRLRDSLGDFYIGDLPKDRYITKSEALELWFEDNDVDWKELKYVIFDDDPSENFASSKFNKHYIECITEIGLTDEDCERAKQFLK